MNRIEQAFKEYKTEVNADKHLLLNIDNVDTLVVVEFEDNSFSTLSISNADLDFLSDYYDKEFEGYRGVPYNVFLNKFSSLDILSWQFEEGDD